VVWADDEESLIWINQISHLLRAAAHEIGVAGAIISATIGAPYLPSRKRPMSSAGCNSWRDAINCRAASTKPQVFHSNTPCTRRFFR